MRLDVFPAFGDLFHSLRFRGGRPAFRLDDTDALHGILQLLGHPGIQALAGNHRGHVDLPVQFRENSGHELPRERIVRILAPLVAEGEVVIHRLAERGDSVVTGSDRLGRCMTRRGFAWERGLLANSQRLR